MFFFELFKTSTAEVEQGCQIFLVQNTQTGKIAPNNQMDIKYTKWS
jgi:hypothetical protein